MATEPDRRRYAPSFLEEIRSLARSARPGSPRRRHGADGSATDLDPYSRTVSVTTHHPVEATYRVTLDTSGQMLRLNTPTDDDFLDTPTDDDFLDTPTDVDFLDTPTDVDFLDTLTDDDFLDPPTDVDFLDERPSAVTQLYRSFAAEGVRLDRFLPASVLAMKAKCFDDGLYAAVELAADRGAGSFPSRREFLKMLLDRLLESPISEQKLDAAALFAAALGLGGEERTVPQEVAEAANRLREEFIADELKSKPMGFYTWTDALRAIFRRDRLLQSELAPATIAGISGVLAQHEGLMASYRAMLDLAARLTNPFVDADLRPACASVSPGPVRFVPPSRAPESELIKKLYGDSPIPDGFDLAQEMAKGIREGTLDLAPDDRSGWYDHQLHALEPLAAIERMPESKRFVATQAYQKCLFGLFRSLLGLSRETHVKPAEIAWAGACMPDVQTVTLTPGISIEPLPTYYLRRASSYRFIRSVLASAFGTDGLAEVHRVSDGGAVNLPLLEELRLLESLFRGAFRVASEELGMVPEQGDETEASELDRDLLKVWIASIGDDPDLATDVRMMVPIFYDIGRRKTKVWIVLGVAVRQLEVEYASPPVVTELLGASGKPVDRDSVRVEFESESHALPYLVTAEAYVDRLLDRDEFRAHCNSYETQDAILANLAGTTHGPS